MAYLTLLSEMMSRDLEQAIHQLKELGIRYLDLKTHIFGQAIEHLHHEQRDQLAELLARTEMEVYCFSSTLGHQPVDGVSQQAFCSTLQQGVENLLETAHMVRPSMIRLLACSLASPSKEGGYHIQLEREFPWVYTAYREAIAPIAASGIAVTIENEPDSVCATAEETLGFFERLDVGEKARYTWDIQNMWQAGVYPSLEVYEQLKPIINYVHLKGGRGRPTAPTVLTYRSLLEDASWPVHEIVDHILKDGISPVLCLNVSHGAPADDGVLAPFTKSEERVAEEARRNIAFLRRAFKGEIV